jgi:hypothetical protein
MMGGGLSDRNGLIRGSGCSVLTACDVSDMVLRLVSVWIEKTRKTLAENRRDPNDELSAVMPGYHLVAIN